MIKFVYLKKWNFWFSHILLKVKNRIDLYMCVYMHSKRVQFRFLFVWFYLARLNIGQSINSEFIKSNNKTLFIIDDIGKLQKNEFNKNSHMPLLRWHSQGVTYIAWKKNCMILFSKRIISTFLQIGWRFIYSQFSCTICTYTVDFLNVLTFDSFDINPLCTLSMLQIEIAVVGWIPFTFFLLLVDNNNSVYCRWPLPTDGFSLSNNNKNNERDRKKTSKFAPFFLFCFAILYVQ